QNMSKKKQFPPKLEGNEHFRSYYGTKFTKKLEGGCRPKNVEKETISPEIEGAIRKRNKPVSYPPLIRI
ncbi:hypothetical protein ScPMuIL_002563, partial [Solemya velum]